MALLPAPQQSPTVAAIYAWWGAKLQRPSRRLGASQIGKECERRLWYGFRWDNLGEREFDGRMLRLFNRGHREEATMVAELRGAGITVHDIDPNTGDQFTFTACGGHFVAKIDGVALGILEAPKTWHVLSFKTANDKRFAEAVAQTPEEHVAQNQIEMHLADLERTFYLAVNKNDDTLHGERLRRDRAVGARLVEKAERVIFSQDPPPRISDKPDDFRCMQCPKSAICHGTSLPAVSCRTCLHATPERDGADGRWSCAKFGQDIPHDFMPSGCDAHLYVPSLLRNLGEAIDASEPGGWVQYEAGDGFKFRNGASGIGSFTSRELKAATPGLLRDPAFMRIRDGHGGVIVDGKEAA